MFRSTLPADAGMLLVFPDSDRHGIWMKNCRFPLDLVWLDVDGHVVDVVAGVQPCSAVCPVYRPARPGASVLELNSGAAHRLRLDQPRAGVIARKLPNGSPRR
jgi:uncharacterized membrane protein (UPF0127 family)